MTAIVVAALPNSENMAMQFTFEVLKPFAFILACIVAVTGAGWMVASLIGG